MCFFPPVGLQIHRRNPWVGGGGGGGTAVVFFEKHRTRPDNATVQVKNPYKCKGCEETQKQAITSAPKGTLDPSNNCFPERTTGKGAW